MSILHTEDGSPITANNRLPVDVGGNITVDNITIPNGLETSLVDGDGVAVGTLGNPLVAELSGGNQDLRGLAIDRPAANSVPVGSTYWSVDQPSAPGTVYVTDGTNWAVVTDLTV